MNSVKMLILFLWAALTATAYCETPRDATALVIDCGPEDVACLSETRGDLGPGTGPPMVAVGNASVPEDFTERCTEFSAGGPQFFEYKVRQGLRPGVYEMRAWVAVQERYKLSLSLLVNGKAMAGPTVFDYTQGAGYGAFVLKARLNAPSVPFTIRLAADHIAQGDRIRARRIEIISLDKLAGDGNVARTAQVTASSSLGEDYPVEALIDGVTEYQGTTRGRSWGSVERLADHWVDFALARPETIDRVVLYWPRYPDLYNTPRELLVQIPTSDGWKTIGSARARCPMPRSEVAFPPVKTDRIRLLMPAGKGALHRPNLLWLNEVEIWRAGTPVLAPAVGTMTVSWSRRDKPDWPQPLKGGEVEGEMLVVLGNGQSVGQPRIVKVVPAAARDEYDWWWDGASLAGARPSQSRVHRLIFAPRKAGVNPVEAVTLSLAGRCALLACSDFRAMPPLYAPVPRMTDAEFFAALDLSRPGLGKVAAAVKSDDLLRAKKLFVAYVLSRKIPPRPRVCRLEAGMRPDENPDELTERLLHHEWYFYKHRGYRPLGKVINWALPQGDGTDRHLLVEFNVMRFLVNRWVKEKDDKWLCRYLDLFKQFYENAPSPAQPAIFPANNLPWDGMGTAIRARGLLEDYFRIAGSHLLSLEDHMRVYKAVLEHARYLMKHDGRRFFAANHQTAHLVALEVVTATFPEFKEAAEWRAYVQPLLRQHFERDTFPDGGTVDTATGYGLWITSDLYTAPYLYAHDAGMDLGQDWRQRLERMYEWCLKITTPDGGRLAVGDDHFHVGQGDAWGASSMGYKGALLFNRPDFLWFASRPGVPALPETARAKIAREVFGDQYAAAMRRVARLKPEEPAFRSVNLPDTGMTILRSDWTPEAVYMFINHHRGGHCHKNQNDLNLVAHGRYFITDPGMPHTFSDNRWQDWYVRTIAHSTVMVDDQDQDYGAGDRGTFYTSQPVDFLTLTHDCYRRLGIDGHQRSVLFIKDDLFLIDDCLTGRGRHKFSWLAHFQPMPVEMDARRGLVRTAGRGPGLTIALCDPGDLSFSKATGWTDIPITRPWRVCEETKDAPYIVVGKESQVPAGFGAALGVDRDRAPAVQVQACEVEGGLSAGAAYRVAWSGGVGNAAFSHGTPALRKYGPVTTDGIAAADITKQDGSRLLFLMQGTEVTNGESAFRLIGGAGNAVAQRRGNSLRLWFEGHATALRIRGHGITKAVLNRQTVTFRQEGDEVVVPLSR